MTLEELRTLYRANLLVEAVAEPCAEQGLWSLEFRHVRGGFVLLTDELGEECHYHNLDLVSRSALAVGFKQLRVESHLA